VTIASRIAEWLAHTDLDSVPEPIRARARLCCMDTVGVALAGLEAPSVRAAARAFASEGAYGFWSQRGSADLAGACFVNATAASALDLDDGYALVVGHAASSVVPAVLTVAQRAAMSGPAALAAMILGYEVAVRAALAREDTRVDALSSGGWTPLGVAAAVGRLAKLDVTQQAHALAIAAAYRPQAPLVVSLAEGAMVKESIGWGTLAGVHAVSLAAAGFEGALTILDRDGAAATWLDDLGRRWAIGESYFKAYAACRWTHAPVDAVLSLLRRHGLAAADVRRVTIETFHAATLLTTAAPTSIEQAQYSVPWTVALALAYGDVGPHEMRAALLGDAELRALARRVTLVESAEMQARFPASRSARVTLETARGSFVETVHSPRGSTENPLPDDWLIARATAAIEERRGARSAKESVGDLLSLDGLPDAGALARRLCAPS
jgi:2-methylcitrate dehydratase PrpD